jgi:hypothetical protein
MAGGMGGAGGIHGTCAEGRREGNSDRDSGKRLSSAENF